MKTGTKVAIMVLGFAVGINVLMGILALDLMYGLRLIVVVVCFILLLHAGRSTKPYINESIRFMKWKKYVKQSNLIQNMKKDPEVAFKIYMRDPLPPMYDYVKKLNPDVVKIIEKNNAYPKW